MEAIVETTALEAVAAATEVLQARIRDAERTKEVLDILKLPFSKRRDNALVVWQEALGTMASEIEDAIAACPEGDWRWPLLSERNALIEAVLNGLDIINS